MSILSLGLSSRVSRQLPRVIVAPQRHLHTRLPLESLPFDVSKGVAPFLSADATRRLAVDWQEGLLDRLNEHVEGTESEGKSLFDTVIGLAKDKTQTVPFNYASEALNNSFFLNGIRAVEAREQINKVPMAGSSLARKIDETYGSLTQLISYFSSAANGMFSSGYVWLACDQDAELGVCATYGGGTVLVQNRQQRGDWGTLLAPSVTPTANRSTSTTPPSPAHGSLSDLTTPPGGVRSVSSLTSTQAESEVSTTATSRNDNPSFQDALHPASDLFRQDPPMYSNSTRSRGSQQPFQSLYPLLSLQVAERAYLIDYGVWGKEEYIRNFWKVVNWDKVDVEYSRRARGQYDSFQ